MTKVIIIGEVEKPKLKSIEVVKYLSSSIDDKPFKNANNTLLRQWNNIELICINYADGLDLIFAYNNNRNSHNCLYLGYFNDGVVE